MTFPASGLLWNPISDGSTIHYVTIGGEVAVRSANMDVNTLWNGGYLVRNLFRTDYSTGSSNGAYGGDDAFVVIFPEEMEITAWGLQFKGGSASPQDHWGNLETSPDTTNGIDGTWTAVDLWRINDSNYESNHTNPRLLQGSEVENIIAVRFSNQRGGVNSQSWVAPLFQVWGNPTNPVEQRLIWTDPDNADIEYSYMPSGGGYFTIEETKTVTIANNSGGDIANGITVDVNESDFMENTSYATVEIRLPSGSWGTQVNIASLLPGASQDIEVRWTYLQGHPTYGRFSLQSSVSSWVT